MDQDVTESSKSNPVRSMIFPQNTLLSARCAPTTTDGLEENQMPTPKSAARDNGPTKTPEVHSSLDQVRDILFGEQTRALETRLNALDERVSKELESLRNIMLDKLESLEASMKKRNTSLERDLESKIGSVETDLGAQLGGLEENLKKTQQATQRELSQTAERLSNDIRSVQAASLDELEKTRDALGRDKADRATLSDLFEEIAKRLRDDG